MVLVLRWLFQFVLFPERSLLLYGNKRERYRCVPQLSYTRYPTNQLTLLFKGPI